MGDVSEKDVDYLSQYEKEVAQTLDMIANMMDITAGTNEVLQLSVPANTMPTEGEKMFAFRDAYLGTVAEMAQLRRIPIIIHGLIKRDSENFEEDEYEMFNSGSLSDKTFVIAAPLGDDAADIVYAGEKFMQESGAARLATMQADGATRLAGEVNPKLVTVFPGSAWKHVGGSVLENQDSVEAKITAVAPLVTFIMTPAANHMLWAKLAALMNY